MALTVQDVAQICHEANRAYCLALGDHSQNVWAHSPEWQRKSAEDGVMAVINNPEQTGEESHENWLAFKRRDGWVYGEVKDEEKKTHPCMVGYFELPEEQRIKDMLFTMIVKSLLPFMQI